MLDATRPCVPSVTTTSSARWPDVFVSRIVYVSVAPGTTGSGLSTTLIVNGAGGGAVDVTCVLTSADVLLSSLDSGMVLSGSTTAVLVIDPAVDGDVALMVIVAFAPAFTAPPVHVTVRPETLQLNRLVPVALTAVSPLGTVSTTFTFVAFAVPMLFTVSV